MIPRITLINYIVQVKDKLLYKIQLVCYIMTA